MNKAPYQTTISVDRLLVDTKNPRLPEMQVAQEDAIRLMIKTQGGKIFSLAQHLAENGTNPASLPIVIPASDHDGMYYVLDGNRRLTAVRLLEQPSLAKGILDDSTYSKVKILSSKHESNPLKELNCVVFSDRDEADPWIQLIHRGQSQGAGLVEWDGK